MVLFDVRVYHGIMETHLMENSRKQTFDLPAGSHAPGHGGEKVALPEQIVRALLLGLAAAYAYFLLF